MKAQSQNIDTRHCSHIHSIHNGLMSLIFSNLPELLLAAEVSVVGVLLSVLDTLLGLGGGVVGAADDDLERCSTSVVKAST